MITRTEAQLAAETTAPVFDEDGMEITIVWVSSNFDSFIGEWNHGETNVWRFDEVTPGRDLVKFSN